MYAEKRRRSEAENEARALQIKENERRREEARRLEEEKRRGEVSNTPDKSENDANE